MRTELKNDMSVTLTITLTEAQARAIADLAKYDHNRVAHIINDHGFIGRQHKEHFASLLTAVNAQVTPVIGRIDDARAVFNGQKVARDFEIKEAGGSR